MDRPKCVVCGKDQTDVEFIPLTQPTYISIGFPVCDKHSVEDLAPDQYLFDQLIVEVV